MCRGLGLRRLAAVVAHAGVLLRKSLADNGLEDVDDRAAPSTAVAAVSLISLETMSVHQSLCDLLLPEIIPLDFPTFASLLQACHL